MISSSTEHESRVSCDLPYACALDRDLDLINCTHSTLPLVKCLADYLLIAD